MIAQFKACFQLAPAAAPVAGIASQPSASALAIRASILASRDTVRQQSQSKFKRCAKGAAIGLAAIVASPLLITGAVVKASFHVGAAAHRAAQVSQCNNELAAARKIPIQGDTLQELATIQSSLLEHARATGQRMEPKDIQEMYCIGSQIVKQLQKTPKGRPLVVGGVPIERANTVLCRAVMWYLIGQAAYQEEGQFSNSAVLVVKDDQHKLAEFFNTNQLSGERDSAHGKKDRGQRCFPDTQHMLPGKGGACWYEQRVCSINGKHTAALVLKTSQDGTEFANQKGQPGSYKWWHAADDKLNHASATLWTQLRTQMAGHRPDRYDSIHQGPLKPLIYTPMQALLTRAIKAGFRYPGQTGAALKTCADSRTLDGSARLARAVREFAWKTRNQALVARANALENQIESVIERLGVPEGLIRDGNEIMLALDTAVPEPHSQRLREPSFSGTYSQELSMSASNLGLD